MNIPQREALLSRDEHKSGLELEQGTPNDVRMFPSTSKQGSSRSSSSSLISSSNSIPIAPSERSPSEEQFNEDQALANYREHVMYQRILGSNNFKPMQDNIHSAPSLMQACDLHLLGGDNKARDLYNSTQGWRFLPKPQPQRVLLQELDVWMQPPQQDYEHEHPTDDHQEEDGVFEMDL